MVWAYEKNGCRKDGSVSADEWDEGKGEGRQVEEGPSERVGGFGYDKGLWYVEMMHWPPCWTVADGIVNIDRLSFFLS